jgi:lysophospholipid hydrolase
MASDPLADLLRGADADTRREIEAELQPLDLPAGAVLFRQGDPPGDVFFLRTGRLGVRLRTAEGTEAEIDVLEPGAGVGEIGFVTGQPRAADVYALEACDLRRLPAAALERLTERRPHAMADYARAMLPRLHRTQLAGVLTGLFGALDPGALKQLQSELEWRALPAGEVLFREGDAGDALYVVVSGRLRVVVDDGAGGERTVDEVGRGASVGEAALLTGDPRSATVYAIRDTHLARLDAALFERVVERHPHATLQIARTAARRSRSAARPGEGAWGARTIALVALDRDLPLPAVAARLAGALGALGPTLHLGSARLDALRGRPGLAETPEDHPADVALVAWIGEQEARHRFVLYEADPDASGWTRRCARQADRVVLVARASASPAAGAVESAIRAEAPRARVELLLLQEDDAERPGGTGAWLEGRALHAHHHVRLGHPGDVARLARRLAGCAVGLVLGGGGARGFAHIGVIRAIEEAGLPIDFIGATSMGAVIGAAQALDRSGAEMEALAATFASRRRLLDPTLPLTSFLASGKVTRVLRELYGEARIEDLWRPFFVISSNLSKGEPLVHRAGLVWEAVRASSAIPGTFAPMLVGGDLVVDGGVLNNLPIDVMRETVETGTVIGSNVVPSRVGGRSRPSRYRFGPSVSGFRVLLSRLPFGPRLRAPGLLSILTRSTEIGSAWRARSESFRRHADLLVEPAMGRFRILDFDAWKAILAAGEESGREQVSAWLSAREKAGLPRPGSVLAR